MGAGPAWADIASNTIVFSGSASDCTTPITVGQWNTGTHVGNGDPGTDQCGANHMRNVKWVSSTQMDTGGGTETLNDTNLAATECTLQILFTDASSVATSSARFYSFDGSTVTAEAIGVEAYAFERGVAATTWTQINDDSGNIGGDNSGERLGLSDQAAAASHTFYIAVSATPESVGAKTQFDFGIALTYS
jgi:hypothetical protein